MDKQSVRRFFKNIFSGHIDFLTHTHIYSNSDISAKGNRVIEQHATYIYIEVWPRIAQTLQTPMKPTILPRYD